MIPHAAFGGHGGHVDFEFTVERDGKISALRMLESSGTGTLDRAARGAITSSRLRPLPDDYAPANVTMRVTFHYGPPRAPPPESDRSETVPVQPPNAAAAATLPPC
jgi:TonB family protein